MKLEFYDIESLKNVFTLCNYVQHKNTMEVFYTIDRMYDPRVEIGPDSVEQNKEFITNTIYAANTNFTGTVEFYNLSKMSENARFEYIPNNEKLAKKFGLSTSSNANEPENNRYNSKPDEFKSMYRLVCDTDRDFDKEIHPYYLGYNSINYDVTLLAHYFSKTFSWDKFGNHPIINPMHASEIREQNNKMFLPEYKKSMPTILADEGNNRNWKSRSRRIYKNMLNSGRHIDVAALNEKQSKVSLKRLLGTLGFQILEDESIKGDKPIPTLQELANLIAYNVSDCVNLYELYKLPSYSSNYEVKSAMLETYPDLVYGKKENEYAPDMRIDPTSGRAMNVLYKRMRGDSTSASLTEHVLCPYGALEDYETVSFMYPSEEKAKLHGMKRFDVLEMMREFFENNFGDKPDIMNQFQNIYDFYSSIRGKNFNDGEFYKETYGIKQGDIDGKPLMMLPPELQPHRLSSIPKTESYMFYHYKDGSPSSSYVILSTGGIHGAEINAGYFMNEYQKFRNAQDLKDAIIKAFPDPLRFKELQRDIKKDNKKNGTDNKITVMVHGVTVDITELKMKGTYEVDGEKYKTTYKALEEVGLETRSKGASLIYVTEAKKGPKRPEYLNHLDEIAMPVSLEGSIYDKTDRHGNKKPVMFERDQNKISKGENPEVKYNKKFAWTTIDYVNHEDFVSYYPGLCMMMDVFKNPNFKKDRYEEIFNNKELYQILKEECKAKGDMEGLNNYHKKREGVKLTLNAGTGQGDASFDNNIRVNNKIISMRIIGQLFTWYVGQYQTLHGANVPSSNTDGIYSCGLSKEVNDNTLEEAGSIIGVKIEPEPMWLVSKDSNQRIEFDEKFEVISASGGAVAAHKDTSPDNKATKPAIVDKILVDYLASCANPTNPTSILEPMNKDQAIKTIQKVLNDNEQYDIHHKLRMFMLVSTSSSGSNTYNVSIDKDGNVAAMPHTSRLFFTKDDATDIDFIENHLQHIRMAKAGFYKITPATKNNRRENGLTPAIHTQEALRILKDEMSTGDFHEVISAAQHDAKLAKVGSVDLATTIAVYNKSIYDLNENQVNQILSNLNLDVYMNLAVDLFNSKWSNIPAEQKATLEREANNRDKEKVILHVQN